MCSRPSGVMVSNNGQSPVSRVSLYLMLSLPQVKFDQYNPEITCLVMKVLGAYISWIDITYIANDKFFKSVN